MSIASNSTGAYLVLGESAFFGPRATSLLMQKMNRPTMSLCGKLRGMNARADCFPPNSEELSNPSSRKSHGGPNMRSSNRSMAGLWQRKNPPDHEMSSSCRKLEGRALLPISRALAHADSHAAHAPVVDKAVVVGGGLGGLATAISLRSRGIDAQVYERRESIGGGEGTMILMAPNGMHALSQIRPQLIPEILEAGAPSPHSVLLAPDGTVLGGGAMAGADEEEEYGQPFVCIAWSDLLELLLGALPRGSVHTGHTLVGLDQSSDHVTADFRTSHGGLTQVHAPLVIGCDGIRSEVRRLVFGIESAEHVKDLGRTLWRAMVPFDAFKHPLAKRRTSYATLAGDRIFTLADSGSGRLYVAFTALDSAWPQGQQRRSVSGAEAVEVLRGFFQGVPLAEYALEVVEPSSVLERRVQETPILEHWAKGRVLLIGDAAHAVPPSLGQGANMVFEDAWELGEVLQQSHSLGEAFTTFEVARISRTRAIMEANTQGSKASYKGAPRESSKALTSGSPLSWIYKYRGHQRADA